MMTRLHLPILTAILGFGLMLAASLTAAPVQYTFASLDEIVRYDKWSLKAKRHSPGSHLFRRLRIVHIVFKSKPKKMTEDAYMSLNLLDKMLPLRKGLAKLYTHEITYVHKGQKLRFLMPKNMADAFSRNAGFSGGKWPPNTVYKMHVVDGSLSDFTKIHTMLVMHLVQSWSKPGGKPKPKAK